MSRDQEPPERLGDFELLGKIGEGGMGEVYKARQVSLARTVAVKVLPSNLARQDSFIERFRREARSAASLIHPNVIQIYSIGVEEGIPFFAMEFVEGEDLQKRVKREDRLTIEAVLDVILGVANALSCAHEKGIVHRDIKPSNIMFDASGVVKVMDFGLAKASTGEAGMSLTHSGVIMGTPNYISPEQGRGDPADGRSDIYSLGVVLYELLTGALPFKADTPAGIIFKHVYEQPDPVRLADSGAPDFLQRITLKMLAKDADDRYSDAKALLDDLLDFKRFMPDYVAGRRAPPIQGGFRQHGTVVGPGSSDDGQGPGADLHMAATESMTAPDLAPPPGSVQGQSDSDSGRLPAQSDSARQAAETGAMGAATQPMHHGRGSNTGTETWPTVQPSAASNAGGRSTSDPAIEILARELAAARTSGGGGGLAAVTITILILGSVAGGGFFLHSQGYLKRLLGGSEGSGPAADDSGTGATAIVTSQPVEASPVESVPTQLSFPLSQLVLAQQGVSTKLVRALDQDELVLVDRDVEPGDYVLLFEKHGYASQSVTFRVSEGGTFVAGGDQPMAGFLVDLEPGQELVSLFERGKGLVAEERLDVAREVLRQVEKIDPLFPGLADVLGGVSERFSQRKAVDQVFVEALQQAEAARDSRDWRRVQEILEEALTQIPPEYRSRQEVTSLLSTSRGKLAAAKDLKGTLLRELMLGKLKPASKLLEQLRQDDPRAEDLDEISADLVQCQALVDTAEKARADGDLERAIECYEQAAERMSDAEWIEEEVTKIRSKHQEQRNRATGLADALTECRDAMKDRKFEKARDRAQGILQQFGSAQPEALKLLAEAKLEITKEEIEAVLALLDSAVESGLGTSVAALMAGGDGQDKQKIRTEFLDLKKYGVRIASCSHESLVWKSVGPDLVALKCVWKADLILGVLDGVCGVDPAKRAVKVSVPRRVELRRDDDRWVLTNVEQAGAVTVER